MRDVTKYVNLVLSFAITVGLGLYLGYLGGNWLDNHLHTSPLFLLLGILLGLATAFKILIEDTLPGLDFGPDQDDDPPAGDQVSQRAQEVREDTKRTRQELFGEQAPDQGGERGKDATRGDRED